MTDRPVVHNRHRDRPVRYSENVRICGPNFKGADTATHAAEINARNFSQPTVLDIHIDIFGGMMADRSIVHRLEEAMSNRASWLTAMLIASATITALFGPWTHRARSDISATRDMGYSCSPVRKPIGSVACECGHRRHHGLLVHLSRHRC